MKTLAIFVLAAFALTACDRREGGGTSTYDTGETNPDGARAAKDAHQKTGTPTNEAAQPNPPAQ